MMPEIQSTPQETNRYSAKIIKFERRIPPTIKPRLTENTPVQYIYPPEQEYSNPGRRALDTISDFRCPSSVSKRS